MGKSCALFGSRVIFSDPEEVAKEIKSLLIDLVERHNVDRFFVGHYGEFERLASRIAMCIRKSHHNKEIDVCFVGAYENDFHYAKCDFSSCLLPLSATHIPPLAKIVKRNQWVVDQSDFIVAWLNNKGGGASNTIKYAQEHGKKIWQQNHKKNEHQTTLVLINKG